MPPNGHVVEYRVTLHRAGPKGMFDAPGFTALISATSPEDAVGQAEKLAAQNGELFRVVDIHLANSTATPAAPDQPISTD